MSAHEKKCKKQQEPYHPIKKYRDLYGGVKKYACPYDLCAYVTRGQQCMIDHINAHDGVKPHTCPHEWCGFATTYKSSYMSHMQSFHTRQGIVKKMKEEYRVIREIESWGLCVDTNVTMYASRHGCLTDTERLYSRVDIVVINVTSCILIVEVDEFEHSDSSRYPLLCELSRMQDINAFLRINKYVQPIYWLRYSPIGKYYVGGREQIWPRPKRELALKKHIFAMITGDIVPRGDQLHYMFYSRVSDQGGPVILERDDFPDILKQSVSWSE